jgi:aromatic ring-opening dioxygenase LigB subunit
MPLTNATLLPHSPLLIPEIGRANHHFLAKTTAAYETVGKNLKDALVETIIIISPHSPSQTESFTINVSPEMEINLQDFGFIPAKTLITGDALLADQIKNGLRPEYNLALMSESLLDHGAAIPAYLLKNLAVNFKLIVISPAENLNLDEQYKFGQKLQTIIRDNEKNIAVIASGDLSHRLKKKSPGGYSPKGAKFDNKVIEYLSEPLSAAKNILNLDQNLITAAGECGLKPLLVLLGLLDGYPIQSEVLAYQTDFGIGYLSFNFKIS